AALAFARTKIVSVGATAVAPRGQFTNDVTARVSALNDRTFLPPALYFVQPTSRRVMFGVGLFVPYGLTSDWPASSEGRFLGYYSSVRALYVQPTAASN